MSIYLILVLIAAIGSILPKNIARNSSSSPLVTQELPQSTDSPPQSTPSTELPQNALLANASPSQKNDVPSSPPFPLQNSDAFLGTAPLPQRSEPPLNSQPLLSSTFFQKDDPPNRDPPLNDKSSKNSKMETGPPLPQRLFLKQVEESNDGFGQVKNYTMLGILFAPKYKTAPTFLLPMIDARVSNINNLCKTNTYGTSLGLIARSISQSSCWMWGGNIYWDYRQGSIAHWFQLGTGIELLHKYCDFRFNVYIPLEGKRTKTRTFEVGEDLFTQRNKFEYPYGGLNAELGWKAVRNKNFQLYLAGGAYYLSGTCSPCSCKNNSNSWGGTFRIRPQYRDFLAVDLKMSDDSIFHLIYQIQVIFSLPLYRLSKGQKLPCNIYNREIYQPVERWDLITLGRGTCWQSNF